MEKNPENIQKYLEEVSKLESSVYEQKQCCEYAQKTVVYHLPKRDDDTPPVLKKERLPSRPGSPDKSKETGLCVMLSIFLALGILALVFGIINGKDILLALGIANCLVCPIALFIFGKMAFLKMKNHKNQLKEYDKKVADVSLRNEQYKKEYDQEMERYLATSEDREKAYEIRKEKSLLTFNKAKETVQLMIETYESSMETLEKVYSYDVIFPKYRNMAAVFTMLEYFQTGRCTELTGPDGAYNLYESELRQNLILNKLDTIIDKLDQIKDNQFLLYSEMTKVNKNLSVIAQETQELLDVTKQVEANTLLTARFSAITAQNTAVIATLTALS